MTQRSTSLNLLTRTCPKALDHYESGAHYDRDVFQVGIAAHAVFEALNASTVANNAIPETEEMERIADATIRRLVLQGRSFDGVPEPPPKVEQAMAGMRLALDYANK